MRRIKLVVAYDGTNYCGWQVQPNGISIQKTLQNAIEDLVGEKICLTGASRTDAGVHALGQVAVFDTSMRIPEERFAMAINQRLPRDIVVQSSAVVPEDFHPRYTSLQKTYCYRILNSRMMQPCERLYSWFVPKPLDVKAMQNAAQCFVGEHDFLSFRSQRTDVENTVRTIYSMDVLETPGETTGSIIEIRVTGDGFLYNMVRIMTGMLVKIGHGQKTETDILQAFENPQPRAAAPTAPAHGLTLVEICYQ